APFEVQPFPRPIGFSTTVGYQSGPPPMNQPMSLQTATPPWMPPPVMHPPGMKGQKQPGRKKNRFPIWIRVGVSILLALFILAGVGVGYYQVNFASHIGNIVGQKVPTIPISTKREDGGSATQAGKIGRASCREREEDSVV